MVKTVWSFYGKSKLENLLNLALSATEAEREKSYILNVGYSREEKTWELIVKYTGSLQKYADERVQIVELYNEYAIITVPETMVMTVLNAGGR